MSIFRSSMRKIRTAIKWSFLVTLPVTICPLLIGTIDSALFVVWSDRQYEGSIRTFFHEVRRSRETNFGAGAGIPTFNQFQDTKNEYNLTRINTMDWVQKLNFELPIEYMNWMQGQIHNVASLEYLVRDVNLNLDAPTDQWVYLTTFGWLMLREWDYEFQEIAQKHAANASFPDQSTRLFIAEGKTSAFLRDTWHTRAPALVHFRVNEDAVNPEEMQSMGLSYMGRLRGLRTVTARVIEFPLQGVYTGIPSHVLPSPREQMHAVMFGQSIVDQFEPHGEYHMFHPQLWRRFVEYLKALEAVRGSPYRYLSKVDDWIADHITKRCGVTEEVDLLFDMVRHVSLLLSLLLFRLYKYFDGIIGGFIGRPKIGDQILAGSFGSAEPANIVTDMMADMLRGFGGFLGEEFNKMQGDSLTTSTTAQVPTSTAGAHAI